MKRFLLVAVCMVMGIAHAALIDFGDPSLSPATGYTLVEMQGSNGSGVSSGDVALGTTGWTINVSETGSLNGGDAGAGANYTGAYPAALTGFETDALENGMFANASSTGTAQLTVTLSGLDDSLSYDLLFYAARGNNGSSDAIWEMTTGIGGASLSTPIYNNATGVADWDGIQPVGGEIVFSITSVGIGTDEVIALNFGEIQLVASESLPTISQFNADSETVSTGTAVTLSWTVINADFIAIDQDVGDVTSLSTNGMGQVVVNPVATTMYTLTASNALYGAVTQNVTVTVEEPAPVINIFSTNTHRVSTNGTEVTLSWNVSDADALSIHPDIGNVLPISTDGIGQISIVLNADATYTLTASNAVASVSSDLLFHLPSITPNILMILVDDYGVTDTSVPFAYDSYDDAGTPLITAFNEFYHTPNMETLAAQGMKFTQAYAMPMCSPTRTSLMTGYNSPRHGITVHLNAYNTIDNAAFTVPTHRGPNNWRYHGMDATDVTLPQLLGAAGYRTIHCGKAHFGCEGEYAADPTAIGFEVNIAGTDRGQPASYVGDYGDDLPGLDDYENTDTFLTDALTQAMNAQIEQSVADGVPFFGYMSYYAVHSPFTTNPDATNDYSAAVSTNHEKFGTMVEGVDISIGDILAKLNELGIAEDTLIVFLGDNGSDSPALTDEGYAIGSTFDDFPLRGKKASGYEGGCRVPLIIGWAAPNSSNALQQTLPIASGSVEHDLVAVEDLVPTILATADVPGPDMDGYDLSPYLRSEGGSHRPQKILRYMPHEHRSDYFLWYREGDWKILYRFHTDAFELYNLADDPDESDDLASTQPERVLAMARTMARELDASWGDYGKLWPTLNPTQVKIPDRPLEDDPFYIEFGVDGRAAIDSDGDGLTDEQEDPDADGLVGETETDPDNADTDGDGSDDYAEIRLNLDPRSADERFSAQMVLISPYSLEFTWPSAFGTYFNILSTTNLMTPVELWTVAASNIPAHAVLDETSQAVLLPDDAKGFYRIELNATD
jgi:arylsulfatase A-like enzyme